MKWIKMKDRRPNHGDDIMISISGGIYGRWSDDLWPEQASFYCACDDPGVKVSYEIDMIDYWMPISLPKVPKDKE